MEEDRVRSMYEVLLDIFMQGSGLLCHPAIYLDLISCKAAAGMGGRVLTYLAGVRAYYRYESSVLYTLRGSEKKAHTVLGTGTGLLAK